jgi:hypothetical protein
MRTADGGLHDVARHHVKLPDGTPAYPRKVCAAAGLISGPVSVASDPPPRPAELVQQVAKLARAAATALFCEAVGHEVQVERRPDSAHASFCTGRAAELRQLSQELETVLDAWAYSRGYHGSKAVSS